MKGFRIIAMTEQGKVALQQQLLERKKQPIHARLVFSRIFGISHDDESMTIQIKNPGLAAVLHPEDVKEKIVQGLREQDAEEDRDFIVEVF